MSEICQGWQATDMAVPAGPDEARQRMAEAEAAWLAARRGRQVQTSKKRLPKETRR